MAAPRVYLAGRYSRLTEIAEYAKDLEAIGFEVTSRWLSGIHGADDGDKTEWMRFESDDREDIESADVFVVFTCHDPGRRGGYHVEFGLAMAQDLICVAVGPVENIFYTLADETFGTWRETLEWLEEYVQAYYFTTSLSAEGL